MNFRNINIGSLIYQRVKECEISIMEICNYLDLCEEEIETVYKAETIDILLLLKWSKLLRYDFFRIYTEHLILHAPQCNVKCVLKEEHIKDFYPKKNIYTKEIIDFILELMENNIKSKEEIISTYGIPSTTLCKWILKEKKINI